MFPAFTPRCRRTSGRTSSYVAFDGTKCTAKRKTTFTPASVAKLKLPAKGQVEFFENPGRGSPTLVLRLSYGGTKAWRVVVYVNGRPRAKTLGRFPQTGVAQARKEAFAFDPKAATRPGDEDAFGSAARRFVEEYAKPHQRRWTETARLLGFDPDLSLRPGGLAARWADRPLAEIDGGDLYAIVDECRRKGVPGTRRRKSGILDSQGRAMAAALSKLFAWTTEHRLVKVNPALGLYKPPQAPARDRVLSEDEVRRFWAATDSIGLPFGPIFKLMLLTGQRESEVGGMRRGELSDDLTTWTLPGDRTKNRRAHVVPLPQLARDIVASMPQVLSDGSDRIAGPYVFTTTGQSSVSGFSKAKARTRRAHAAGDALAPPRPAQDGRDADGRARRSAARDRGRGEPRLRPQGRHRRRLQSCDLPAREDGRARAAGGHDRSDRQPAAGGPEGHPPAGPRGGLVLDTWICGGWGNRDIATGTPVRRLLHATRIKSQIRSHEEMPLKKPTEDQFRWDDDVLTHDPTGARWWWAYPESQSLDIGHNPGHLGDVLDNGDDYDEDEVRETAYSLLAKKRGMV